MKPDPAKDGKWFPDAWWELFELAINDCPEIPFKAYRKSMIGRGHPLTAKQANAAVAGSKHARAMPRKAAVLPETPEQKLIRARWYIKSRLPLVLARPIDYDLSREELNLIRQAKEKGLKVKLLQWDADQVHRTTEEEL